MITLSGRGGSALQLVDVPLTVDQGGRWALMSFSGFGMRRPQRGAMSDHDYVWSETEDGSEVVRFRLGEAGCDPATTRCLIAIGVTQGWRCLDVGAGGGSVARWLAERVGPDGSVVAVTSIPGS